MINLIAPATHTTDQDTLRAELGYRPSDEVAAELEARKAAWSQKRKAYEATLDQAHAEAQEEQARLDRAARTARVRRFGRLITDAVRSITNPAALVQAQQPEQPPVVETPAPAADPAATVEPDPQGLLSEDELPETAVIEAAAAEYAAAADMGRAADRRKRKARKLIDRVPAGVFGRFAIERIKSSRMTVDVEAVRATYARLGLGEVPMRPTAPTLRVTELAADVQPAGQLAGVAA